MIETTLKRSVFNAPTMNRGATGQPQGFAPTERGVEVKRSTCVSHNDWHLTTEQLSALLDGQLSSDEQARLQTHLHACQQCQLRLADLRQTVALLHALPQPSLPRSFTLPVDDAVVTPISAHSQRAAQLRRSTRPGYIRTTMRTLSAIAAVLGIVFLLSTALPLVQGRSAQFSASSAQPIRPTGAGGSNPSQATKDGLPANNTTPQTTLTPHATTPHATATPEATAQAKQVQPGLPVPAPFLDLNNGGSRALLGLLLLIAGILSFILFSRKRLSKP